MPHTLAVLFLLAFFGLSMGDRKVGDARTLPVDDPDAIRAAHSVLSTYDSNHPEEAFAAGLVRVVKATRQVVAGTLTRVELEWAPSACRKPKSGPGCPGVGAAAGVLKGKVWAQPW